MRGLLYLLLLLAQLKIVNCWTDQVKDLSFSESSGREAFSPFAFLFQGLLQDETEQLFVTSWFPKLAQSSGVGVDCLSGMER